MCVKPLLLLYVCVLCVLQMMVAMKRAKWDGCTTGSRLAASVAKVHDELKVVEWLRLRTVEMSLPGELGSSHDSDAARA